MKKIYKWQKIIIWIIGVLTFLSITAKVVGEEIFVGYFIDVVLGVAINVFVLFSDVLTLIPISPYNELCSCNSLWECTKS